MRFVQQIGRVVLITLVVGWLVALLFGLWIARLQYDQVSATLPPSQVSAEYEARIDRELKHGLLLFLPQVGVMAATLVWQVADHANRTNNPQLFGTFSGAVLGVIQSINALALQVPWIYVVALWAVFIGVGTAASWLAKRT